MSGLDPSRPGDSSGRRQALLLVAVCGVGAMIVAALLFWLAVSELPKLADFVDGAFSSGLGLRGAAIVAAIVSFLAIIALTLAAGDSLIGEIHFVLPGFFVFFLFFWLMTAWVF